MTHLAQKREIVEKWDHYHTCYKELLQAYQDQYAAFHEERSEPYAAVRDEVAQFAAEPDEVPATITAYIAENGPGYWTWAADGLHYQNESADLADLLPSIHDALCTSAARRASRAPRGPAPPHVVRQHPALAARLAGT